MWTQEITFMQVNRIYSCSPTRWLFHLVIINNPAFKTLTQSPSNHWSQKKNYGRESECTNILKLFSQGTPPITLGAREGEGEEDKQVVPEQVVILTEFYKMPTKHNIIPGGRSYKTLANCGLAGH
jgi:hypothetical protein